MLFRSKMEKFSQEIRNAINIYRSGGKAVLKRDENSFGNLLLIYDNKDLLEPAMKFFLPIYNKCKEGYNKFEKPVYIFFNHRYYASNMNDLIVDIIGRSERANEDCAKWIEAIFYYFSVQIEDPGFYNHLKNTIAAQ